MQGICEGVALQHSHSCFDFLECICSHLINIFEETSCAVLALHSKNTALFLGLLV